MEVANVEWRKITSKGTRITSHWVREVLERNIKLEIRIFAQLLEHAN